MRGDGSALVEDIERRAGGAALLGETARIAGLVPVPVILSVLACAVPSVIIDTMLYSSELANALGLLVSFVQIGLQLWLTIVVLDRLGLERLSKARFVSLVLIGIPMTIAIGIGTLLLVLPGIYLAARWRLAVPILIARDADVIEAMRASWRETEAHWKSLMIATAVVGVPIVVSLIAYLLVGAADEQFSIPLAVAANLLLYGGFTAGWLLDLAAYRLIADPRTELAQTFA